MDERQLADNVRLYGITPGLAGRWEALAAVLGTTPEDLAIWLLQANYVGMPRRLVRQLRQSLDKADP
jgi:hypothetical protein